MFGVLNVYKPQGITSHDVVAYFRKLLKIKQIGHTGTLDPFAEGVLPVCLGKATKLIQYLPDDKAYIAFVQFGVSTETYDAEGKITYRSENKISQKTLENEIKAFEGEIEQTPPIYSAIKIGGKKLYEYAREGKSIEIPSRKVFINKIELKNFDEIKQTAEIYIECSKGTYIRSIANDLGNNLKCGAHLYKLIRTKVGKLNVETATEMSKFSSVEITQNKLLNPIDLLNYPSYVLNDEELKKVLHGQSLLNKNIKSADFIILIYNNNIKAIGKIDNSTIKMIKVFENV